LRKPSRKWVKGTISSKIKKRELPRKEGGEFSRAKGEAKGTKGRS